MSAFKDPFDDATRLGSCSSGRHHSQAEHDAAQAADLPLDAQEEALNRRTLNRPSCARCFRMTGSAASCAPSAVDGPGGAVQLLPLGALEAMAPGKKALERASRSGFIPITCAPCR